MTLPRSAQEETLRAAVLAAVEAYLGEEAPASGGSSNVAGRWRAALRSHLQQPNLWRALAWTHARHPRAKR